MHARTRAHRMRSDQNTNNDDTACDSLAAVDNSVNFSFGILLGGQWVASWLGVVDSAVPLTDILLMRLHTRISPHITYAFAQIAICQRTSTGNVQILWGNSSFVWTEDWRDVFSTVFLQSSRCVFYSQRRVVNSSGSCELVSWRNCISR